MDLKGSKTEKNLATAYSGESQARNKYTYFASKAKKDGFEQIADIFTETANNEKEHAKIWYKILANGIGTTAENLLSAAEGENYEWTEMYAQFAQEAREEGFDDIASLFESVGAIEKTHEERFRKLLNNVNGDLVFSRDNDMIWECGNCGHIHFGKKAPEFCPVCKHPQSYFKIKAENSDSSDSAPAMHFRGLYFCGHKYLIFLRIDIVVKYIYNEKLKIKQGGTPNGNVSKTCKCLRERQICCERNFHNRKRPLRQQGRIVSFIPIQ